MSNTKPTIVIVPGAWQKPVAWDGFQATLNEAGYPTEYVALKTVGGVELPLAGLPEDVAEVQAVLKRLSKEGKKALLLCHSSGGVVGSNAAAGFDDVLVGIIYLSAFLLPKGKSLLDMLGGQPLPWMDVQGDRVVGKPELLPAVAFNDLDAEGQAQWAKEMSHTSALLFTTPSGFEPWSNGIPCKYIFCTSDNALPYEIQQQMALQLGSQPNTTATLNSGHCPFLSKPTEMLSAIQEVV